MLHKDPDKRLGYQSIIERTQKIIKKPSVNNFEKLE